jgi:hypothetical protein
MEILIEGHKININDIVSLKVFDDNLLRIYFNNDYILVDVIYKNKIDKLLNKDFFYISDKISVNVREILKLRFIFDDALIIDFKNNSIYTNIRHKKLIETLKTRKNIENF